MLKIKNTRTRYIHSHNIPSEWCQNMDYAMVRLITSMLSRYLKEFNKRNLSFVDEEDLNNIIETRDLFCQLVRKLDSGVALGNEESTLEELKNKCFNNLSKILFMLWL